LVTAPVSSPTSSVTAVIVTDCVGASASMVKTSPPLFSLSLPAASVRV
jgi:hypothetical protein